MENMSAKGKIIHLSIEKRLSPHRINEIQSKIDSILIDVQNEKGETPFNWKWIENEGVVEAIFENLGINYFHELDGIDEFLRDEINSEVTVSSNELGLAGTIDMLVKHSDDTYSIVDWKTGNSMNKVFRGMDDVLMKYGNQASAEIPDSIRNRAKLQIALYAVLLRAENPNMQFRSLNMAWIPSSYNALQKDPDMAVDVGAYIPMIKQFLSDPVLLKEAGLPGDIRDKLLAKDPNIFNANVYSTNMTNSFAKEIRNATKTPEEQLAEDVAELGKITSKSLDYKELSKLDKARADELLGQIQHIDSDKNVLSSKKQLHDLGTISLWIGNFSEVDHPMVQAWKQFKDKQELKAQKVARYKTEKFQSLLIPFKKEYIKKNKILKTPIGEAIDYDKMYGWMYVDEKVNEETTQTKERLLTNTENDPELKARYSSLTIAQKNLLNYVNDEFSSYFIGEGAYLNETAVELNGKTLSHLELFNTAKNVKTKREWHKGFFFKLPPTSEDIILRNGEGKELKGRFSKKTLGSLLYRYSTFFRENQYEGWDNDVQALPIKFLGNDFIDSSKAYTRNMEIIFFKAIAEMEKKKYMDPVYSTGKALEYRLSIETIDGESNQPAYENLSKFMNLTLLQKVQGKIVMKNGRERGLRLPMYTPNGWQNQKVSTDAIVRSLTKWASMNTMWLRPFQGTGNGVHAMLLTHREGIKGSIANLNLLGIKGESIDFTYSDIVRAEGLFFGDYVKKAMTGNFRESKIYLLAKEFNYFGNNFDYADMEKTLLSLRNRYMSEGMMYLFHSLPEEFVSMTTMVAQLLHMKNESTGESIYDSYKVDDILDDNGKKTGQKTLKWTGGVRGEVVRSSGDTEYKETLMGLDSREQARLRKVHERLQGGYRKDEATLLEVYAVGKMFVHLKKYFPRLILNALHAKRRETDLGAYKKLMDPKTGKPILKSVDGKDIPQYEWQMRVTEGKFRTLMGMGLLIASMGTSGKEYSWDNLSDEQKNNITEALITWSMLLATYGMYIHIFDDDKEDSTMKKWWKMYLIDNLSQQYNPIDLSRTMKTIATPVAIAKAADFVLHGWNMTVAGSNYAVGNDDAALTKQGDLKGWNSFIKTIPLLSSYKDIMNKVEHTEDANSTFNQMIRLNKLR